MHKLAAFAVASLMIMAAGAALAGELDFAPRYTGGAASYAQYKEWQGEASWLVKSWADPAAAFKDDRALFAKVTGKNQIEMTALENKDAVALRRVMAETLAAKSGQDPYFEGILKIARTPSSDRILATQSASLLVEGVQKNLAQYKTVAPASRGVFMDYMKDEREGIRYVAMLGLAALGKEAAYPDVVAALMAQLDSSANPMLIEGAARALGETADASAVRPLMVKFIALPAEAPEIEDQDTEAAAPGKPTPGKPINPARLETAIAVQKLAGQNFGIARQVSGIVYMDSVNRKFDSLSEWWKANEGNYK